MQFESANPSVVRSIRQRDLLNTWLRAVVKPRPLPVLADYRPECIADELPDMMGFDVEGRGDDGALPDHPGRRHADQGLWQRAHRSRQRTNRYLDDAIGPERYEHVVTLYRTCLAYKRPTYSISMVQDPDGKDVQYERLLLPFGSADRVEQIVGSYKAISIEGHFKIRNLMGMRPRAVPAIMVRAVIDQDIVRSPTHSRASEDIIELK